MPFEILRSKTFELFKTELSKKQIANSQLNKQEALQGKIKLQSYPRRILLELTNACNFNCIMCGRDRRDFQPTFLDAAYIDCLAGALEYCEEVTLFGWGEPTIHPDFKEIIKRVSRYPVRKYFVTNGSTLRDIEDVLFDCQVEIMAVSLDGANARTNNRIRRNSDFERIVEDLKHIVRRRKENNTEFPYINFVFTMMKTNIDELPEMVKLAREIGIEEVKAVYMSAFSPEMEKEVLWKSQGLIKDNFASSIELARKLEIKIKLPYLPGEDPAAECYHKDCFVGWRDFFIGSDHYVRPCQSTSLKLFKFNQDLAFAEIWNSPEFQQFRRSVNYPELMPDNCKRCYQSTHANFNRKQAFIHLGG